MPRNLSVLAQARMEKGLTQIELAELMGYQQHTISRWENRQWLPKPIILKALAETLGITTHAIIEDYKAANPPATNGHKEPAHDPNNV